ncbi:MAG: site-2 protease family protein [Patescibacteria group bacterium]
MAILIFVVILCVLIVGHEAGHLIAAKLSKMKVLEFGIGFPPKLAGKTIGGTLYSVNALPFGGFVKILGEEGENANDPAAFSTRPKLLQAMTIAAGPIANFVLAFLLTSFAFMIGVPVEADPADLANVRDPQVVAAEILPGTPAETAGLRSGDRLMSLVGVDGVEMKVTTPEAFSSVVERALEPLVLVYERNGAEASVEVTPVLGVIPEEPERRALGIGLTMIGIISLPPHIAIAEGFMATVRNTVLVAKGIAEFIGRAFSLQADLSAVSGPVGIVSSVGTTATFGVGALLSFAAIISINLGIVNLIPFPALDGGRIAMIGVEALTRRKIPRAVANGLNFLGFALLILLMLAVTVNDISHLVG